MILWRTSRSGRPRLGRGGRKSRVAAVTASIFALLVVLPVAAGAQVKPGPFRVMDIAAPADPTAIPLYPEGSLPAPRVKERWGRTVGEIGALRIDQRFVRNVTKPTMTPVLPDPARATGAAVIVAPGGAFLSLSIDNEGFNVARWLADRGIAAFVLKYRLNETPDDNAAYMQRVAAVFAAAGKGDAKLALNEPRAVEDVLHAVKLVRAGAGRWGVDPKRVGVLGFSAGARATLQAVLSARGSQRPEFFGYIYGQMGAVDAPADAPPMFAAIALDDGLYGRQGFGIVESWQKAKRPVELHAYEKGDHGFGIGRPGTTTMLMMDQFRAWLDSRGLLKRETKP